MSTTEAGRRTGSGKPDNANDSVSLRAVIDAARRLDELSSARVVGNAADAVHAAQKAGLPLGAVTPSTIILRPDGGVRLVAGPASPGYTAPERLRGGAGDRRAEVFALGVVLWEALAHERLFDGATDEAVTQAVLEAAFRPPSELNANVPAELDAICKRALARDPAGRYPSARVMAAEIDAVLGDAGYPESNEQIAVYVVHALAIPDAVDPGPHARDRDPPAATSLGATAPSPAAARAPSRTLPPPPIKPAGAAEAPGTAPGKAARTEILGSVSSSPDKPIAVTAFLGSHASASPAGPAPTMSGTDAPASPGARPPASAAASPLPVTAAPAIVVPQAYPIVLEAPAFVAPLATALALPQASGQAAPIASARTRQGVPVPFKASSHPHPPVKPSIANAETLATPQLPAHLAVPPVAQLEMPPGITVAPSLPPAPRQSADRPPGAFDEDHHADPAEVVALHHADRGASGARESRDVLAGWGWTTGSLQAIDDDEDHAAHAARAARKRLLVAIGGSLSVALVIAIAAFAFRGSKPSEQDAQAGAAHRSATAPPSSATAPVAPSPPAAEPQNPAASSATPPAPEPPAGEAARSEPIAAVSPEAASPNAANVGPELARPQLAVELKTPAPAPEPAKLVAPEPGQPEPPTVAASKAPEAVKIAPPKPAPPRKVVKVLKPEPTKQAELRKPDRAPKRPPADRLAKAQPIDPYAMPVEKRALDPAEAYKTGLQQYARGDTTGALATFRGSLSSNPTFAPTWRGLGLVYEKLGNKGQARSAFKRYLQLAPTAGDADQIRDRMERLGS